MSDLFDRDELQEEIDFFINGMMERVLEEYSLKKEPVDGSLESSLNAYTKEKLLKLATENGIAVQRKWKKAELVGVLSEGIMQSLDVRFLILQKRSLVLLQYMADGKFDLAEYAMEQTEFLLTVFEVAVRMGMIYVWEVADGVQMSIPVLIKEKIDEALIKFEELEDLYEWDLDHWAEMNEILAAGVHLYGVMPVGKFYELWEIRFPLYNVQDFEKMNDAYDKIERYLPLLAIRNGYYFVEGNLIAHPTFDNEEDILKFYQYRSAKMGANYYKPLLDELLYYSEHDFKRDTLAYKRLKLEAAKMSDDYEMLMQMVESYMLLGHEVTELLMHMLEMGVVAIESEEEFVNFIDLYYALEHNTRLWAHAGFTPEEMDNKWRGRFGLFSNYSDFEEDDDDLDLGDIISLDDFR